tara:strand:- start:622 stop:759 length:138 start_codon:yes stop_codon:yes gene_type:complete
MDKPSAIALLLGVITTIISSEPLVPVIFFATTIICMAIENKKENS